MTSFAVFHDLWHLSIFHQFKNAVVSPPPSGPRYLYHLSIFLCIAIPSDYFSSPFRAFHHFRYAAVSPPSSDPRYLYHPSIFFCITIPCDSITPPFELPDFSRSADRNIRSQYLYHLATVPIDVLHYHVFARSVSNPRQTCRWNTSHRDALSNGTGVERGLRKVLLGVTTIQSR